MKTRIQKKRKLFVFSPKLLLLIPNGLQTSIGQSPGYIPSYFYSRINLLYLVSRNRGSNLSRKPPTGRWYSKWKLIRSNYVKCSYICGLSWHFLLFPTLSCPTRDNQVRYEWQFKILAFSLIYIKNIEIFRLKSSTYGSQKEKCI